MNNLSSVLIVAKKEYMSELELKIAKIPCCSVELCEEDKMVVVIESANLDEELKAFKELESLPHIISANMVFSYQDLDEDMQKAINSGAVEVLKKDEKAEDVRYFGNIYKQV